MQITREFLYRLEDEINRARYEINEQYHMGDYGFRGLLKPSLGRIAPAVTSNLRKIDAVNAPVQIASKIVNNFNIESPRMSITGAAPVTLSIKQMIEQSRQTVQAAHQKLTTNAAKVSQAAAALDSLGDDLGKEGDDLLAMVGQYKNDIGAS